MAILLGYETALDYWRSCTLTHDSALRKALLGTSDDRRNATANFAVKHQHSSVRQLYRDYLELNPGHHVILLNQQLFMRNGGESKHTFSKLPPYSCMYTDLHFADEQLFISTPEYCFLQMAMRLPLELLIELGYELCGTYSLQESHARFDTIPLTSPTRLVNFLDRSAGIKGVKKARRALRYILPNSASPMETKLAMLLCLPKALGGYGIPFPQLNYRINAPASLKRRHRRSYFKCDLYWKAAKFAIEYDSDLAHAGVNKIVDDAIRRDLLETLGITVFSVTRPQVYGLSALSSLAHLVSKKVGVRLQHFDSRFAYRHRALRDLILFSKNTSGS